MDDASIACGHGCEYNIPAGISDLICDLIRHFNEPFFSSFSVTFGINENPFFCERNFIDDTIEDPFNRVEGLSVFPNKQSGAVGKDIQAVNWDTRPIISPADGVSV